MRLYVFISSEVHLIQHLIKSAVTLFVVIDPIGTVPLFIIATRGLGLAEQRRVAIRATVISALILVFFITAGQLLLDHLGIGLNAFKIAGGLVLLAISMKMILEAEPEGKAGDDEAGEVRKDVAVFPVAMPFIAGPGAILAVVLLTDNDLYPVIEQAAVTGVLMGILLITWLTLFFAAQVQKWLGETGVNVVTRIMGLILAALSIQTILIGIQGFFKIGV